MSVSLVVAVIIGAFIGVGIAAIPLLRQWRRDQRILRLVKQGLISVNEAREMRNKS